MRLMGKEAAEFWRMNERTPPPKKYKGREKRGPVTALVKSNI